VASATRGHKRGEGFVSIILHLFSHKVKIQFVHVCIFFFGNNSTNLLDIQTEQRARVQTSSSPSLSPDFDFVRAFKNYHRLDPAWMRGGKASVIKKTCLPETEKQHSPERHFF